MTQADGGTLLVELLYEQDATVDDRRLLAEVSKVLPRTVLSRDDRPPTMLVHEGCAAAGTGALPVPVMSVLMRRTATAGWGAGLVRPQPDVGVPAGAAGTGPVPGGPDRR